MGPGDEEKEISRQVTVNTRSKQQVSRAKTGKIYFSWGFLISNFCFLLGKILHDIFHTRIYFPKLLHELFMHHVC